MNYQVFSYNTSEYLKDMGTPSRFEAVEKDLKNNIVSKNLTGINKKCFFLIGTIPY